MKERKKVEKVMILFNRILRIHKNLTHEVLMGIKWVTIYDFDTKTVNNNFTFRALVQWLPMQRFLPIWNSAKRWYIPMDIYLQVQHPYFFSGTGYVLSGSLTSNIYTASFSIRYKHFKNPHMGLGLQSLLFSIKLPPKISLFNLHKLKFS